MNIFLMNNSNSNSYSPSNHQNHQYANYHQPFLFANNLNGFNFPIFYPFPQSFASPYTNFISPVRNPSIQ